MYSLIRRFEGDYIGFRSFVRLQMCIKAKTIDMITLHVHKQSGFTGGSPGHCTSLNARNSKENSASDYWFFHFSQFRSMQNAQ